MKRLRSRALYKEAQKYMPGGVNSPVRAFKAVGGTPLFIKRGIGSRICDEDGNEFLDYVMSWGALILGHAPAAVARAIAEAGRRGTSFGAPTKAETELAQLITRAFPSIEKMRLVNSGTEATMSAIRLSRGFTGREKLIKFEGCYHGHSDSLLVKAGSGGATFSIPDSAGVPRGVSRDTIVARYNDLDAFSKIVKQRRREIACVIVEPVAANMGVVLPAHGFLSGVRELTARYGIVLIFDEVICGFRLGFGGAQTLYGITPDLTCLGKIIGGGLPIGAYGGREEIMECVAPCGTVYQAGTLSGNPVAVSAGLAVLRALSRLDYGEIEWKTEHLCNGLGERLRSKGARITINRIGSMFTVFFTGAGVTDYRSAKKSDVRAYARFFRAMLEMGVNLPPSQFEANFLSFSHTRADIDETIARCAENPGR